MNSDMTTQNSFYGEIYVFQAYAKSLLGEHSQILSESVNALNYRKIDSTMTAFYYNFTVDGKKPSNYLNMDDIESMICMPSSSFSLSDLKTEEVIMAQEGLYSDTCEFKAYHDIGNIDCKGTTTEMFDKMENLIRKTDIFFLQSMVMAVMSYSMLYIIWDLIERWVYVYTCISSHTSVSDMAMSLLSKKVPGSYLRKQLNVLTCFSLVIFFSAHIEQYAFVQYCLVFGMVFRFIMHIHSMRLMPGIGHFVITTFTMGTNLLHFSLVYAIVLFIFAVIFHILIHDTKCPLIKYNGFENIVSSMFETFKLTFGHGEFDAYSTSTSVMLTYTLFVIMSALLFMNLIIAIMSKTATDVMTNPWKDTLWRMEWLEEALSVEYTFSVLALPFSRCCHCSFKSLIELFHCPAITASKIDDEYWPYNTNKR